MESETERLLLRKPMERDFDRFWGMVTDPVAKRFTGGVTRMTYPARKALFLEDAAAAFGEAGAEFAVIEKSSGRYLGYCGFRCDGEGDGPEFLYGYCRDCWGNGYATEAARAVLAYLFQTFPHEAYHALAFRENRASARILEKLGFVRCGARAEAEGTVDRFILTKAAFAAQSGGIRG